MPKVRKVRILFICTGNSARSQMAEGILRQKAGNIANVYSGGTNPAKEVNPLARKVMAENGIDISSHYPKGLEKYLNENFDIIVTTCDNARQSCPVFPGKALKLHWDLPDPAEAEGDENECLAMFRRTFAEISKRANELMKIIHKIYKSGTPDNGGRTTSELILNIDP